MADEMHTSSPLGAPVTKWLKIWMRTVGTFYVFLFVATAILKLPIQALAPEGTLDQAANGDGVAMFLVDTWVILGLAIGSIGVALWVASRNVAEASVLVWTVIGFELIWGIFSDIYQIVRGHPIEKIIIWVVIHVLFITTGILALRSTRN